MLCRYVAFLVIFTAGPFQAGLAARILGIVPTASYSHQVAFRPIWAELSLRGHQVVLMTTDPMRNKSLTNLTEIDWHNAYAIFRSHDIANKMSKNSNDIFKTLEAINIAQKEVSDYEMKHPEVQALLNNKNTTKFDIVLVELAVLPFIAFSEVFGCPYIGILSMDTAVMFDPILGNPNHPVLHTNVFLPIVGRTNFFERLQKTFFSAFLYYVRSSLIDYWDSATKEYFGNDIPHLSEIMQNIAMLFNNVNPVLHDVQPVSPSTVFFGGSTHLEAPRPLPKNVKDILDNATNGVVYFSMGTNAKSKDFPGDTKKLLLEAFAELPYTVLWKYEEDELPNRPDNVKIAKWLPQQHVLRHPNVKVFITQVGAQSMEESIYANVPMLGLPFFADQQYNAKSFVLRGFGLSLDHKLLNKEELKNTILELSTNPKYKKSLEEASKKSLDRPMSGLQQAVWWTEYVLRHKDTKHLRTTAAQLSVVEYYLLDVIGFTITVGLVILYTVYKLGKLFVNCAFNKKHEKKKNS